MIKRCSKRKLFIFLRRHRHEIFDDEMQAVLQMVLDCAGVDEPPC